MKVQIDQDRCSGHGRCYTLVPEVFDCDDEGFPVVLLDEIPADGPVAANAHAATVNCPERALSLVED